MTHRPRLGPLAALLLPLPLAPCAARRAALETVTLPAGGGAVTFRTPLDAGGLFLLEADGAARVGAATVDAGAVALPPPADPLTPVTPGRGQWLADPARRHAYCALVDGTGRPLSLRLPGGAAGAGRGGITVALFRLSPPLSPPLPKPLETLAVPVLERTTATALTTRPGAVYLLQASGDARVGGGGLGRGDAEYMDYRADGAGREDIGDAHTDYGLGVDEADQARTPRRRKWGPWRRDHTYYMLFAGTGRPLHFFYYDVKGGYGDNSPAETLTVRVFALP